MHRRILVPGRDEDSSPGAGSDREPAGRAEALIALRDTGIITSSLYRSGMNLQKVELTEVIFIGITLRFPNYRAMARGIFSRLLMQSTQHAQACGTEQIRALGYQAHSFVKFT